MTTALAPEGAPERLRRSISGSVLTPADSEYDVLRLAWNRSYVHRPSLIVRPTEAEDVATAVRFAARSRMPVAVQATGHGVAATADSAMLILTRTLDQVTVDAAAATAVVGAGAKWGEVLELAAAAELAPLLGSTPDVGAVGYTLGGGIGWMARNFGLSIDHVRWIEIVTSDGQIRRASHEADPDLFWALRGAGAGSLGVVTAMEIDLVPVTSLYAGNLFYPATMAREVGSRYRQWIDAAPNELTSSLCFMNFPTIDDVPAALRGNSFAIVRGAFVGSDDNGMDLLDFWRGWRAPDLDLWGPIPITDVGSISNDPVEPMPGLSTSNWLESISDSTIDVLSRALFEQDGPSPITFAEIRHAGGAISAGAENSAYSNRSAEFLLQVIGVTPSSEAFYLLEQFIAGVRAEIASNLAPGAYLNFLEGTEKLERARDAFEPDKWERLKGIKAHYDPLDLFNCGIPIR